MRGLRFVAVTPDGLKDTGSWKTAWRFLKKSELLDDPENSIFVYLMKKKKKPLGRFLGYLYPSVHSSIFHNSQVVETTQMDE